MKREDPPTLLDTGIKDKYDRQIDYFRISITDRCNLNCMYCVPHDLIPKLPHGDILKYEEILRLVRIGVRLGITKVRITGGEPLVRKGVYRFLSELTAVDGLEDLSLTTNGVFLRDNVEKIMSAGIQRINISIDTLRRDRFLEITGQDHLKQVREGIELAHRMGIGPIKLNVVALRGINDDEILDFAKLSFSYPFHIRFIEHMAIGNTRVRIDDNILAPEIRERIGGLGKLNPVEKGKHDGPAELYQIEGAKGQIGFITALSNHFCHLCNRIRLTASGQLRPCLLSDYEEDLKGPMRSGCSDEELAAIFRGSAGRKGIEHQMTQDPATRVDSQMSTIGG